MPQSVTVTPEESGAIERLMILVDEAGGFFPSINHSPWNDVTFADFVMPFFLFIVGVALALAYKNVPDRVDATRKAVLRALKLFIVGLILQGGYFHGVQTLTYGVDILNNRFMGVLQRISIAYLVAALCQIWLRNEEDVDSGDSLLRKYRYQVFVGLIITSIYLALLYGLYVPDWEYQIPVDGSESKLFSVKCGVRGDTGPACNTVGMIDRKVLGIHHLYRRPIYARTKQCSINSPDTGPLPADAPSWCQAPFDPEGLLSNIKTLCPPLSPGSFKITLMLIELMVVRQLVIALSWGSLTRQEIMAQQYRAMSLFSYLLPLQYTGLIRVFSSLLNF